MTVPLLRGSPRPRPSRSIRLAALRVPLATKLVGANMAVVAALFVAWVLHGGVPNAGEELLVAAVLVLHFAAVLVALRPIRDLETVVERVWHGDLGARVERSSVADSETLRVGSMFNILLDGLVSDRARMRALAAEVIAAGDRERAALARELHDSTAQHVAALLLQLSVSARDAEDPVLASRLMAARDSAEEILEEVRQLSHTMHPGVLDDLGLEAALRRLARDSSHGNGIDIDVNMDRAPGRLPRNVEAVLYRVAQEAVRNATRHASPRQVRVVVHRAAPSVTLEVHDDGKGFDPGQMDRHQSGIGLQSMRERLSLVDGWLEIKSAKGSGTTISATVPLDTGSEDATKEEP